ncbi:MAG: hypothetical protein IT374_18580 [Polyangiaceae bacterium]|nr:hypothetical protein [Polyangiaceae bacterium]
MPPSLPPLGSLRPAPPVEPGVRESLLILSDVHLGSDLNAHARAVDLERRSPLDRDLVDLVRHYRAEKPPPPGARRERWRLVLAGDFIDFIGMSVHPDGATLETPLDDEERAHGLGSASDHARLKLALVARRHARIFDELGAFLADGHAITFIHGNHDPELQWASVQRGLREVLRASAASVGHVGELDARVDFQPWFFHVDGVAYVEHGHQYDTMCATERVLSPRSPLDPRRMARGFTDVLLRTVVRPTRGLREHGHDRMRLVDYLAFAARLGVTGMLALGGRFVAAIVALLRLQRAHLGGAARAIREEHERRMEALSAATRVGLDKLRALAALQAPPITRSARGVLGSLMVDSLLLHAVGAVATAVLIALAAWHPSRGAWALALPAMVAAWVGLHASFARARTIDPTAALAERAHHLARLFPTTAFVVMGHTHVPTTQPIAHTAATYVNLGSWAEEAAGADDAGTHDAARTHLVIQRGDAGPTAELRAWDPALRAPRRYDAG